MRREQFAVPEVSLSAQEHFLAQTRLYQLLAVQVRHYTNGESGSVPSAVARELLASVLFCLDNVPEHTGTWEHILLTQEPEQALAAGLHRLNQDAAQGKQLWEYLCCHMPTVENRSMIDTLRSIGTFWQRYDIRFFAHQIPCDIDYQLSVPVPEQLQGVAYVNRFLAYLVVENDFLLHFTQEAMVPVLERHCPDYQGLLVNLFAPVAATALGLCLLDREPWDLRLCMEDCACLKRLFSGKTRAETENLLIQSAEKLSMYMGAAENTAARAYLSAYARTLSPRIRSAVGVQTFAGIEEEVSAQFSRKPPYPKMSKSVSRVLYLTVIYLDALLPTRSSHLLRTAGPAMCPRHGVAPDRVYSAPLLPGGRVSSYLAFPPLLPDPVFRTGRQRYISVALFLRSLWADVIRYPCPAEPGLSSQTAFRHCLRDCLAYSRKYFIG